MSKFSFKLEALFEDSDLSSTVQENIKHALLSQGLIKDEETSFVAGTSLKITSTTSLNLGALPGVKGETVSLQSVRGLYLAVVKTAAAVSGSVALACQEAGISTATRNLSASRAQSLPVGAVIMQYFAFDEIGVADLSGADLVATLTSPVGFEVVALIVGDLAD